MSAAVALQPLPKIEVKHLTVNYAERNREFTALRDVNFTVEEGEFVSVIGASGCGKSTLLSVLEGLYQQADGTITISGEPLSGTGKERGVVFQHYSLFPWMTTRKNIAFGIAQVRKDLTKKQRLEIADTFLEKVGLGEFGEKYPSQLSGGMQQRAAIARALAMDTEILLMDEPFSAIDAKNRIVLQELLLKLWEDGCGSDGAKKRRSVVFVTHDIDEAILLSDKIVVLTAHPGTVAEIIPVPFERPRDRKTLVQTPGYGQFRNRLLSLFYNDIAERIGGEEVVL
ncbi:ABC transporter ATP-binding protein [Ruminococcus flavefaciens]|uniref:ABC transporter ATP-binding protein n=1 Tax=Ruminococcus flavefaciens TaxID=1265 RepID=UPI00156703B8|nr:ABC transporter ATP-binding protein [Ruminococcus flavefaciens]